MLSICHIKEQNSIRSHLYHLLTQRFFKEVHNFNPDEICLWKKSGNINPEFSIGLHLKEYSCFYKYLATLDPNSQFTHWISPNYYCTLLNRHFVKYLFTIVYGYDIPNIYFMFVYPWLVSHHKHSLLFWICIAHILYCTVFKPLIWYFLHYDFDIDLDFFCVCVCALYVLCMCVCVCACHFFPVIKVVSTTTVSKW